jgi:hypothetical protein
VPLISQEVVLHLVATKCLPILMYGSEACCLTQSNIRSLGFAVNRFLMKLFKTANINVIKDRLSFFDFELPSTLLLARTQTFLSNYTRNDNSICKLFGSVTACFCAQSSSIIVYIYIYIYVYKR